METPKIKPDNPIGLIYQLGYNLWKVQGSNGQWHYISAHLNPILEQMGDNTYLLMCSCRSFTIGIPSDCKNPFLLPCKHILRFDESQVDVAELEKHT